MTALRKQLCLALALGFVSLPAAAGSDAAPPAASAIDPTATVASMTYLCAGGKKIVAVIDHSDPDHPSTRISVEGDATLQDIELHDVPSANGVKTSNDKLVWWTKGDEGFLAENEPPLGSGEVLIGDCREMPAQP